MHSVGVLEIIFGGDKGPYTLFFYFETSCLWGLDRNNVAVLLRRFKRLCSLDRFGRGHFCRDLGLR